MSMVIDHVKILKIKEKKKNEDNNANLLLENAKANVKINMLEEQNAQMLIELALLKNTIK